ncbi:hypothetical protein B4166_1848 [Caldibacillus thermoamylovorans]|uniref:Uncharacterized protein n=1 Tax=Caldibacillus thermoamylovorans TaxID=35841 RepID=A0ABD4A6X6_9BACI|nr:hypothetical protein B4166_1848 [Caldibacillus thermoamylovorans]KIO72599.1 hypothetical protein B4167_2901 [Caldibacillus thermoamylovorans]
MIEQMACLRNIFIVNRNNIIVINHPMQLFSKRLNFSITVYLFSIGEKNPGKR